MKTITELFESTWKHHWSKPRYEVSGWGAEAKAHFRRDIEPHFGSKAIDKLRAKDIRQWHADMAKTPFKANRALDVLSRMYKHAIEQEWIPQNTNPCKLVHAHEEKSRKRYATVDELKLIGAALNAERGEHPVAVAFLFTLMFTGSRPRALERATWSQLRIYEHEGRNFGELSFDGKTGEETVIIPPQAIEQIISLPRRRDDLIFGIRMPRRLWSKIKTAAGIEGLWARDLRRTFATVGFSNEVSSGVVGELLNHKSTQTTKIYAKLMNSAKSDATCKIADSLEDIMKETTQDQSSRTVAAQLPQDPDDV